MPLPAQQTYDRLAPTYDRRWSRYTEATLRATLEGLSFLADDRVLDLAAGTGELARRIQARWPEVSIVGLDLSHEMLSRALGKTTLALVQADAARLPLASASFDQVVCANAFHLFPKPTASLTEILRVLRPGGKLTITDWCDDYLSCKICSLYLRLTDRSFHRAYILRHCRSMLQAAGFEVREAARFKIDWLWGLMRIEAVVPHVSPT